MEEKDKNILIENLSKLSNKFNFKEAQRIDNKYIITDDRDICGDNTKNTTNFWYSKFALNPVFIIPTMHQKFLTAYAGENN